MNLYTIYDKVADEGGPIFEAKNHGVAARKASMSLQKVPSHLLKDYKLYCVGKIETSNGVLQGCILNEFEDILFEKAYWEAVGEEIKEKEAAHES